MSDSDEKSGGGSGFGWFILGGLVGLAAGAYIASGPGRGQVDSIRSKTIELSGSEPVQKAKQAAQRARVAVADPGNPVGKAIQDGVAAAKRRCPPDGVPQWLIQSSSSRAWTRTAMCRPRSTSRRRSRSPATAP